MNPLPISTVVVIDLLKDLIIPIKILFKRLIIKKGMLKKQLTDYHRCGITVHVIFIKSFAHISKLGL
jgi:hypothetical protein